MPKAQINPALDNFRVPIDSLIINPENVQKHDGKSIAAIAASLNEFGQQKPIIANSSNIVIAGNGTLEAAQALEWDEIAVVISDLDAEELQKGYAIADNKTQEFAEWDYPNLTNWLADIDTGALNIEATGFTADEIKRMMEYEAINYGDLDKELDDIEEFEDVDITLVVAAKYVKEITEWLANGELKTAAGMGRGVLKRCGLL